MAFYLDEGAYSGANDMSYIAGERYAEGCVQPAYGIDSAIFSDPGPVPTRTTRPPRATVSKAQQYDTFSEQVNYDSRSRPESRGQSSHDISTTAETFPLVDGDFAVSPFHVKSLTRDGRLKTKLMGIGHDGGFLTSPIITGPPRSDSRTGGVVRPEISIDSPLPQHASENIPVLPLQRSLRARSASVSSEMVPSLSMGTTASSMGFASGAMSSSTSMSAHGSRDGLMLGYGDDDTKHNSLFGELELAGLGMGLTNVPALDDHALDLFGPNLGANPNVSISQPTFDEFADLSLPPPPRAQQSLQNAADIRLTQSGRLVFAEELEPVGGPASPQQHRQQTSDQQPQQTSNRPVKALPTRSLNKAKSCSALSPSAREMAARSPYYDEPLTPVSAHASPYEGSYAGSNSASTGSAGAAPANRVPDVPSHLLSFADLYHYGLVQEAALATSIRQSPLNQMPASFGGVGLIGMSGRSLRTSDNRLYPSGSGTASTVSSPGAHHGMYAPSDPASHYRTPEEPSSAVMLDRPSTASSRSSLSHRPAPVNFSRPGVLSQHHVYALPAPSQQQQQQQEQQYDGPMDNPANDRRQTRQQNRALRQPAESSVYGNPARNFSYPTRFASAQQREPYEREPYEEMAPVSRQQPTRTHMQAPSQFATSRPPAPEVQWAQPPPQIPLPPVPTTPRRQRINPHARCLTGPAGSMADYPLTGPDANYDEDYMDEYEQQLATYDSLYQPMQLPLPPPPPPPMTAGKRAREHHDDLAIEAPLSPSSDDQRPKRLRSVASAPCLQSRRLKPGPRPKVTKTPEQEHQSVFNATLSPAIPQIHRGASPFSSPLLSEDDGEFPALDANGQIATTSTITYVPGPPALPGQPRSSVPREVIQSLYSHIPSHLTSAGVKVPKRYVCLIEGCERSFPRKSAIESHIQTHLEDKPFICPHDDW